MTKVYTIGKFIDLTVSLADILGHFKRLQRLRLVAVALAPVSPVSVAGVSAAFFAILFLCLGARFAVAVVMESACHGGEREHQKD